MTHRALIVFLVAACGAGTDGNRADGGGQDAAAGDGAGDGDSGAVALFEVSGECGELDTELTEGAPSSFDVAIEFSRPFVEGDELSEGGAEILADGNAGGSSLLSEVFAFEGLDACESLTLLKTETEIVYDTMGTRTDFLAEIDGVRIGVSVTRAQTFPLGGDFTEARALALLSDKLGDIVNSTANVSAADAWQKQILAVMVYNRAHLASLELALPNVAPAERADTIVWFAVTDGPDDFIYTE